MRLRTPTVAMLPGLALCLIPKNANSAMRVAVLTGLGHGATASDHRHPALDLKLADEARPGDRYKAAFLRHPLDRLVSCYADKVARVSPSGGSTSLLRLGYRTGMAFSDFVAMAASLHAADIHTRRQGDLILPRMDFIGRVERLPSDWERLRARFPWLAPLGRMNASPHGAWADYYDATTRAIAAAAYAEDMDLWERAA